METVFFQILKLIILPPGSLLLIFAGGLLFAKKPKVRLALFSVSAGLLFLFSLPIVSMLLNNALERYPVLSEADIGKAKVQAIVVLAAGRTTTAMEYGGETISRLTAERLRYGMFLHRKTGLPIVLSGGSPNKEKTSEAQLMHRALLEVYGLNGVARVEGSSRNTWENAVYSKRLLVKEGIDSVFLVTHAWHMPRAADAFEQAGLNAIAAPTGFHGLHGHSIGLMDFLPRAKYFYHSVLALHEIIGLVWYSVKYVG